MNPAALSSQLTPLHDSVAGAAVVGLGEATHGSREFFLAKHGIFQYLVRHEGFTVFAIEASLPEAEAINRYVAEGVGDPAAALAGLHFWMWNTQEVLDLIRWMRAWNADARHAPLKFYGFDCQYTATAGREILEYLHKVDSAVASSMSAQLKSASDDRRNAAGDAAEHRVAEIDAIARVFVEKRDQWISRSSTREWQRINRYVEILRQAWQLRIGTSKGYPPAEERERLRKRRDSFMADNILWIRQHENGAKVVLWGHNGHVAVKEGAMGGVLRQRLGNQYAAIGFSFGEGDFRAIADWQRGEPVNVTVSATGGGDLDRELAKVDLPAFGLALRDCPSALRAPLTIREFGSIYVAKPAPATRSVCSEFDGMIFVRRTTAAKALAVRSGESPPRRGGD